SPEPLAALLHTEFSHLGRAVLLGEVKTHCMITTYDVLSRKLRLLRSWTPETQSLPLWEACMASCSAPTSFPAHVVTLHGVATPLIDGGVAANNPSSLALAEAIAINSHTDLASLQENKSLLLVSMGTGNLTKSIKISDAERWGGIDWAFPILDVVFDGGAL